MRRLHGLQIDHAGQFEKRHAHLEENRLQGAVFGLGKVALGLLSQNAKQIDGGSRAKNVNAGALALLGTGSHLDHGGDIELLHQVFEGNGGLRADGRILGADDVFEALGRGVVGGFLLVALLGRGRGRQIALRFLAAGNLRSLNGCGHRGVAAFVDHQLRAGGGRGGLHGRGLRFGQGAVFVALLLLFGGLELAAVDDFEFGRIANDLSFPISLNELVESACKAHRRDHDAGSPGVRADAVGDRLDAQLGFGANHGESKNTAATRQRQLSRAGDVAGRCAAFQC